MNKIITITLPYILIAIGAFILFMTKLGIVAGVCFLIGIVIIIEQKWPEKWEADKKGSC